MRRDAGGGQQEPGPVPDVRDGLPARPGAGGRSGGGGEVTHQLLLPQTELCLGEVERVRRYLQPEGGRDASLGRLFLNI